jgi:hypothetical protein
MAARRAHNPKVTGSNPVSATKKNGLPMWVKPFLIFSEILKYNDLFFICSLLILKSTVRYDKI